MNNFDTVREALHTLIKRDQINTCQHDNTHRGGSIWEICDDCGMEWADDRGGKPEWKDPPEWEAADKALTTLAELERQHYTPEDVADASAKGFRDGVASVTAGQEPVAWQRRMRPTWGSDTAYPWSPWEQCTKGQADDHWKTPLLHEWAYEARALYTAAPVAQQTQARPDFTDEWTGYLKDGETPFERFLRERKDLNALTKLYQRALEENERLKAQQPRLQVGDSQFESWYNEGFDPKNKGLKQQMREAYEAGMNDPVAQQPQEIEVQCPVCNHKFHEWPNDKQPQAEAVPVVDRVYEAAKRLVDHADFQLGGVLSAKSKARDIPSNAASKVKARHLASLRDALAKTPQQTEAVPAAMNVVLEAMRSDPDYAWSWHCNVAMAFVDAGGDRHTANQGAARFMRLLANVEPAHELPEAPQQDEAVPPTHVLVPVEPTEEIMRSVYGYVVEVDTGGVQTLYPSEYADIYRTIVNAAIAAQGEKP